MKVPIIVTLALLSGCAHYAPVTRIVHVRSVQYVPIPATLLMPCPAVDPKTLKTNGDLLSAYLSDQASIQTCNGQLKVIKTLATAPAT